MISVRRLASVALLAALLVACGGGDGDDDAATTTSAGGTATTTESEGAGNTEIVTVDFSYEGLTVVANQPLTVRNDGNAPHTVTSPDDEFEEVVVQPGETMTLAALAPGTYEIICRFHAQSQNMVGTLTVS